MKIFLLALNALSIATIVCLIRVAYVMKKDQYIFDGRINEVIDVLGNITRNQSILTDKSKMTTEHYDGLVSILRKKDEEIGLYCNQKALEYKFNLGEKR
jgi:hypothetical protein